MSLIDTHSHLYLEHFKNDLEEVIDRAKHAGVSKIFLPNIDSSTTNQMFSLVEIDSNLFYPMMGLHPCSVKENFQEELAHVKSYLNSDKRIIAIGEIGIDLYWDKTFIKEQKKAFAQQIEWAKEMDLPIAIHARDSFNEIFEVMDIHYDERLKGVFHCFTGNIEQAKKALSYDGFMLGLGGVLTFKNSELDEVIKQIDLSRLILETDAPYLTPSPYRGKRNESSYVSLVAKKLSEIKGEQIGKIEQITSQNALSLFKKVMR